jgi:lipopolysaccharide/colanic/teichoic acid biosynthesis glycosyltransferase
MDDHDDLPPNRSARLTITWLKAFDPDNRIIKGNAYLVVKRLMDLGIVILSAPFWLLVVGVIALAIKIDSPGAPVIFTQLRTGKGGKRFKMYKFRTMVPHAEELKSKYAALNELKWPDFKITNDPRITRIGKFLRKSSLDELPQLFNILTGEMSLVGPRPTSFSSDTYTLWQTERLDITPGLTGLWQIIGRGVSEFDDRLRLDIAYSERRSIWLDINILVQTVWAVFAQRGAH